MSSKPEPYVKRHADGTVWAKGTTVDGVAHGYFEWFRKDGSKMRSGYFEHGKPTGEWTTYDKNGQPFKTTDMTGKDAGEQKII